MPRVDYARELEHPFLRDMPGATQAAREIRGCQYPYPRYAIALCNALDVWVQEGRPRESAPFYNVRVGGPQTPTGRVVEALVRLYLARPFDEILRLTC